MKSINPATGELIQEYQPYSSEKVAQTIDEVHDTFLLWKQKPVNERTQLMARLSETLLQKKEELARIATEEMGKPLRESVAEIEKCAATAQYYAEKGEEFLREEVIKTDGEESYVVSRPMGVILAIMPWNFPYWQALRFAIPALTAGNGAVLKHASNVSGCALALEKIFREAGFPENLFRTLLIPAKAVSEVIENKKVAAVTLTGSTEAGKAVAKKAGEMVKKNVLELGGSDPYLVLADADLDHAAETLVKGRMVNAGQSCISPKRIIVHQSVYQDFVEKTKDALQKISFGEPTKAGAHIGPLARVDLRNDLHDQVQRSVKAGAQCLLGGTIPEREKAFYPPTLLVNVRPGMPAFDEEMFGPVLCLIEAKDEEEAIELANQSSYGLGGGIFSRDLARAKQIAETRMETGGCFINDYLRSDPRLPFGGIKESGYGRELSHLGLMEFVNKKTVYVK